MRILFVIQGEGRGHLTQALSLRQKLVGEGHEVVGVLVGKSPARRLPAFFLDKIGVPVYPFESPNFLPTAKNKQVNLAVSIVYNLARLPKYLLSVRFINRMIRETEADVVVNFYELLTGFTYFLFRPKALMICIAHQYLFLHPDFKFPDENRLELAMLRFFTRLTAIGAAKKLALSFRKMREYGPEGLIVVPPLLRHEVLDIKPKQGEYLFGYLLNSGFSEEIIDWHRAHPEQELHFFWDRKGVDKVYKVDSTLTFNQIDDKAFLKSLAGCRAYATTAGFESVCEAMYLGKPILMVPAHIEQDCNAHDASRCGAGIVSTDFDLGRLLDFTSEYTPDPDFRSWVDCCAVRIMSRIERAAASVPEHHMSLSFLFSLLPSRFAGV